MQRLIGIAVATLGLVGCASTPGPAVSHETPQLRLAPSLLGRPLNLQQHLTLHAPGRDQQLDVLLEADARHVQMGLVAMGQVAARLDWDGTTLTESRAPWWPQEVSGSRILSDLQLTLWPVDAIQAALPAGWRLVEEGDVRTLTQDGQVVTVITRLGPLSALFDQRREHFQLKIESRDLGHDAAGSANPT